MNEGVGGSGGLFVLGWTQMSSVVDMIEMRTLVCESNDSTSDLCGLRDPSSLGSDEDVSDLAFEDFAIIIMLADDMGTPMFINICVMSDPD